MAFGNPSPLQKTHGVFAGYGIGLLKLCCPARDERSLQSIASGISDFRIGRATQFGARRRTYCLSQTVSMRIGRPSPFTPLVV